MSFAASALRKTAAEVAPKVANATRSISSSRSALGGAHEPHYVHAEHMYEIWTISNRKAKVGAATLAILLSGFGIPCVAAWYAQYKTKA